MLIVFLTFDYFYGPYLICKCTCTFTYINSSTSHVLVSSEQLRTVVPHYFSPRGAGTFTRDFTANLAPQCRAFTSALEIEKLKARLFPGPGGAGATSDWCITSKSTVSIFIYNVLHFMGGCLTSKTGNKCALLLKHTKQENQYHTWRFPPLKVR